MSLQSRYCKVTEDPYKEHYIRFPQIDPDEYPPKNMQILTKNGESLRIFEKEVNEDIGCYIYVDRLPPVEEEDPKKAKTVAKGKAPIEELKPSSSVGWVSFLELANPGTDLSEQRVLLKTVVPTVNAD